MDSMKLQQIFEELCELKMNQTDAQSKLVILAKAIWYDHFIPSLATLKREIAQRRGGYLKAILCNCPL